MYWQHKVASLWLEIRKQYLTATEAIGLLAEAKRNKFKKWGPNFVGLWGEKQCTSPSDPTTFGSAARGHCLEPYAIEEYNRQQSDKTWCAYHWDDIVIHDDNFGYSPDGLSIPQLTDQYEQSISLLDWSSSLRKLCFEVKCYEAKKHTQQFFKDKEQLEERYQIAYAFSILSELEAGVLIFYNPSTPYNQFRFEVYTREELKEEIEQLQSIKKLWLEMKETIPKYETKTLKTEEEIWKETQEAAISNSF